MCTCVWCVGIVAMLVRVDGVMCRGGVVVRVHGVCVWRSGVGDVVVRVCTCWS